MCLTNFELKTDFRPKRNVGQIAFDTRDAYLPLSLD